MSRLRPDRPRPRSRSPLQVAPRFGWICLWGGWILLVAGIAWAQGSARRPTSPPSASPPSPAQSPLDTAPLAGTVTPLAAPDTLLVLLSGPDGWPAPTALAVEPDSVQFGGVVTLVVDFPATADGVTADSLRSESDRLVWEDTFAAQQSVGWLGGLARRLGIAQWRQPELRGLPPPAGVRISRRLRLFRAGPCRFGWKGGETVTPAFVEVRSLLTLGQEPVTVRTPRALGWYWQLLVGLVLTVVAALWLVWWLRRRRRVPVAGPVHAVIPPPAYLTAANALWALHVGELPGKGEGKRFLDRLAQIARGYLVGRFGISAEEMTSTEIRTALERRGYTRGGEEKFAGFLQMCDDRRYAPGSVPANLCQDMLVRTIKLVDIFKIQAQYTPVPAELAVSGQKSWAKLADIAEAAHSYAGAASGEGGSDV